MTTSHTDWAPLFKQFQALPEAATLHAFIVHAYATEQVLPPRAHLFTALNLCSFAQTRVVILGQDPYPTPGQAHGLAFSVQPPTPPPGSLRNIFKEITADIGTPPHITLGDLSPWASQGVLLLNAILTCRAHAPLSHANHGWEQLTDLILATLSQEKEHLVFLLWGAKAQKKRPLIDASKHLILTAAHPSPLSAYQGFLGCKHFSQTNAYLTAHGLAPIQW